MSASLAGEIAQLHELFKLGALTQEEFNEAKQATIRNFRAAGGGAAAAPPAASPNTAELAASSTPVAAPTAQRTPPSQPEAPPPSAPASAPADSLASSTSVAAATRARTLRDWKRLWDMAPVQLPVDVAATTASLDIIDLRVQALRCLGRLLRNVQAYPAEPKYRHARESNKVIAQELMPVAEASTAVLSFAGFVREADDAGTSSYTWVLRGDDAAAVARKAANAARLVEDLSAYYGEQQTRRYGLLQLWRSVALEVRLEQAASSELLDVSSDLDDADAVAKQDEEHSVPEARKASNAAAAPRPLLQYLIECYTTDEAGDGLYTAAQHLQTLTQLYEAAGAAAADASADTAAVAAATTHSLLATAEVYGAVVQQRGAVELLMYGCGAHFSPAPAAAAAAAAVVVPGASAATSSSYTVALVPCHVQGRSTFVQRCLRLLRRLWRELNRVKEARTRAARQAAEAAMRQEMRRERQRRQLEVQHTRDEDEETTNGNGADSRAAARLAATPSLRPHQRRRTGSSSSSSSTSSPSNAGAVADAGGRVGSGAASKQGGRRIPVAEALAILMGKKSPPTRPRPPPAAASSPASSPK